MRTTCTIIFLCLSLYAPAQTDSTTSQQRNWDIVPMISGSPEFGLLLGVNPIFTFKTNPADTVLRTSFFGPQLFGTFKKQFGIQIPGNLFFQQNRYALDFMINGANSRWRYYGIGNEIDLEEYDSYRFRGLTVDLVLLRRLFSSFYAGAGYRYNYLDVFSPTAGGLLETEQPAGHHGYTASGPVMVLRWESRDNVMNAYRGSFINIRGELHRTATGSTHHFEVLTLDFRHYIPLSQKPYHVLAFQVLHQATFGSVPFTELGMIGGSMINRGYFSGAYRDRHSLALQIEYRQMLGKKIGGVLFLSGGNLMSGYNELDPGETRFAAGIGLRFALLPQNRVNLRFDYAVGRNSRGQYFGINEAF